MSHAVTLCYSPVICCSCQSPISAFYKKWGSYAAFTTDTVRDTRHATV
jgi:hypothetical protein